MKFKKLTALFIAVVLVFGVIPVFSQYIDVENQALEMRIDILEQLGIISGFDDATFRPDEIVTRGEFSKYVARLFSVVTSDRQYFDDVTGETENVGYINALKERGMVSGDGNRFFPNKEITGSEAIATILRGLGYGELCESVGGYPNGYLNVANRLEIKVGTAPLTRDKAVKMIYDTLTSRTLEVSNLSREHETFSLSDTLMAEKYLDLKLIEGILTYNGYASIDGSYNEREDFIIVNGVKINLDGNDVMEYLGFNVTVFAYKSGEDDYHLRAISKDSKRNNVTTVFSDNIVSVSPELVMKVENNSSYENYSLLGCVLIYNGQYRASFSSDLLKPDEGYVYLINSDNDSKIDTVIVYSLKNDVIKDINTNLESLYFETGKMLAYKDKETVVYTDDVRSSVNELAISMSVSYCENSEFITIWASTKKVSGLLSMTSDDFITIADEDFKCSSDIYVERNTIELGKFYTAYISHYGKVVRLTLDAQGDHYGYLLDIYCGNGFSKDIDVKLLSDTGAIMYLKIVDKVRINGTSGKATSDRLKTAGIIDINEKAIGQLIKYNANDEGRITSIEQSVDKTTEGIYNDGFSLDKSIRNTSTRIYRYNVGINYHLGAGSFIFYLPLESEVDIADETDYTVGTLNTFSNDIYMSNFDVYDTKPDRTIGVFVVRRTIQPAKVSDELTESLMKRTLGVVVNNRFVYDDEEDDYVTVLDVFTNGKATSLKPVKSDLTNSTQSNWTYSKTPASQLREGDIFIYSKNEKDEMDSYTILFRGNEIEDMIFKECVPSATDLNDGNKDVDLTPLHTVFGEVVDINGTTYSVNVTEERNVPPLKGDERHIVTTATAKVYVMDYLEGEHRLGEISDINVGDIIFARLYNYVPDGIVVFKGK